MACGGLYLSKKRAGCRGGTYAWYPKCSATSYLGVGIRLYRANRQARRQGGRRDARLAAPMNRDGRPHDATRWCWWPLGGCLYLASSAAAMSGPRGRRVWTLSRMGGGQDEWVRPACRGDTASAAAGGDGSLFSLPRLCVQTLWTRRGGRRCLVAGRAGLSASRRPSSSALCMPLDRSCWSASRTHTQALQQEDRFVRTAHHGSLRLGVCMTIVLCSKRNNGCFRLPIPSNKSRHRTRRGPQNRKGEGEKEKLANPTTVW